MYKVLLVDDERHTREGLSKFVDWSGLNTMVCGEADDGVTALPLLKEYQPDILVTDVRMRSMDGIELARQAKELLPGLSVIFLSGYNDPEYLQNAVRLSAADYLYKPVTPEEFSQVMQKVVRDLDAKCRQREQLQAMREHLRRSRPILQQAFLSEWLDGVYENPADLHSKTRALDLPLALDAPLQAIILLLEDPMTSLYDESYLLLQLRQVAERNSLGAAICTQAMSLVVVREAQMQGPVTPVPVEDIAVDFHKQTGAAVSIAVGMPVQNWADIPLSYQDALSKLENRFFSQQGNVLNDSLPGDAPEPALPLPRGSLADAVRKGNREQLFGQLYDISVAVHTDKLSISDARMVYLRFLLHLDEELRAWGLRIAQVSEGIRALANSQDYQSMESTVRRLLMSAVHQLEQRHMGAFSAPVSAVIDILETEYSKKLTIDDLAQRIHYSPSYLCDLFKSETQRTIGEHLMTVRMEKAVNMLQSGDKHVLDIALDVGYSEQTHFTRLFKRYTGLTPLEYRRRSRK